ncbi:FG-GAP-like repeat-containing protein [Mariniflexile litorale]|uniref:FG-GAP-like repeat-containing protein n=1 Tax=Mariniflexile litorale TaxID=3045158 RepID=A0AAU7EFB4_9FLAO|nr:FG-GAP-like repeat-containing protein [Mariniflexile sp. KMM 9835]MDQ8210695.1 FG-GAP-like repeat-containing protein [Mariniflexile sp. KMM 9835]
MNRLHGIYLTVLLCFLQANILQAQTFERVESFVGLNTLEDNNGVSVADYDQDGDLDIFVVAKAQDEDSKETTHSKLFTNNNNGTFTDVTNASGLINLFSITELTDATSALSGFKFGAFWGDYDNDGFPDLFLTNTSKISLFHNEADGTFKDVTSDAGFQQYGGCVNNGVTWFDYNNDGFLDIYISDWETECGGNRLYKNNGNGTFVNVSDIFQSVVNKHSYQSVPFDFNNDGWLDLYIANDFASETNDLFINNNGVSFTEEAANYGLGHSKDDMGIAIGDYNNDGLFDFFVTSISANVLYSNNGGVKYTEQAETLGVSNTYWSWDVNFSDFDLDRDEDLFILNGFEFGGSSKQNNVYFENLSNNGRVRFVDSSNKTGLGALTLSVAEAVFDFDNDGDLDIFVTNGDRSPFFYENKVNDFIESNDNLHWFKVKLEGTTSNRDAIGTKVSIKTTGGSLHRYYTGKGFLSQSLKPIHFGLGNDVQVLELKIIWPSGIVETYNNLMSDTTILVKEGIGYEVIETGASKKIYGCTDPNSCNYNPNATISTGDCNYLQTVDISGNINALKNSVEFYNYPLKEGSSLYWEVEGGIIIEQGDSSVRVQWNDADQGEISLIESNGTCVSIKVALAVSLNDETTPIPLPKTESLARIWNETLLSLIRKDYARPTVHARNLFHASIAMYDAWAIYDAVAQPYLIGNTLHEFTSDFTEFTANEDKTEARKKTISYAMYRLLSHRFKNAPNPELSQGIIDGTMSELGYDASNVEEDYSTGNAIALGNYIANQIINYGLEDGANEVNLYKNSYYSPVNTALNLSNPESMLSMNPNRWQPLSFNTFIDQSGNVIEGDTPAFLGPEWGHLHPFSLEDVDKTTFNRSGNDYHVYHDPGAPPIISDDDYKWTFSLVSKWGSHLDPRDGVLWDISPNSIGNISTSQFPQKYYDYKNFYNEIEGGDIGMGYVVNPYTKSSYEEQLVPRGDYTRVLAEFWADGPDSETPPGHWFTILNYVNDHELLQKKFNGQGLVLDDLEWDVKAYFILGGAMHDSAISAWGIKGWYDYIRPISAIRYMCERGQSSDPTKSNYNTEGIPLKEGFIEMIEEGDPLIGNENENLGKIKLYSWKGHDFIDDPEVDEAGVGWILAETWWPYQRPSFVTPPFAGYVSGHSTYSRAAAEVMTLLTGDAYFPGGMGEFLAKKNAFLVFEAGPSVDVKLQWATYRDASDQCSLSRIWGGIHPPIDDIPGRIIGEKIGKKAFKYGTTYFNGLEYENLTASLSKIKVYPNPLNTTSNQLFVTNTLESDSIYIYDMNGRLLQVPSKQFDKNTSITRLSLSETLSTGIYILKINSESKKLIVF